MSVDQKRVVDFVSDDRYGNKVLTISDHLDWTDAGQHLLILQDKINSYLAFVESGEIYDKFPDAAKRRVLIQVLFKHKPNSEGLLFLSKAKSVVEGAGFGFHFEVFGENPYTM